MVHTLPEQPQEMVQQDQIENLQASHPKQICLIVKAGNGSFMENHIIDALSYAKDVANQLNEPIVVNFSLGGNSGPARRNKY